MFFNCTSFAKDCSSCAKNAALYICLLHWPYHCLFVYVFISVLDLCTWFQGLEMPFLSMLFVCICLIISIVYLFAKLFVCICLLILFVSLFGFIYLFVLFNCLHLFDYLFVLELCTCLQGLDIPSLSILQDCRKGLAEWLRCLHLEFGWISKLLNSITYDLRDGNGPLLMVIVSDLPLFGVPRPWSEVAIFFLHWGIYWHVLRHVKWSFADDENEQLQINETLIDNNVKSLLDTKS